MIDILYTIFYQLLIPPFFLHYYLAFITQKTLAKDVYETPCKLRTKKKQSTNLTK